jgi:hypothetical protein
MGYDKMMATIISECVLRPDMKRLYTGDRVDISYEEYKRLYLAGCIKEPLPETSSNTPPEIAARQNPRRRGSRPR